MAPSAGGAHDTVREFSGVGNERVPGLGFWVWSVGFGGTGFRGLELRVWSLGFRGKGFRV